MNRQVLVLLVLLHYVLIYYAHIRCGRPKCERLQTRKKLPVILIKDWVLTPIMIIAVSVYFLGGNDAFWQKITLQTGEVVSLIGAVIMLIGFILKYWAYMVLGRNWSPKFNVYDDHELVQTGPFSFFVHPIYASYFLTFGGYSLYSGNILFLILSCLYYLLNLARAWSEEKALCDKFGETYAGYYSLVSCRQSILLLPLFF